MPYGITEMRQKVKPEVTEERQEVKSETGSDMSYCIGEVRQGFDMQQLIIDDLQVLPCPLTRATEHKQSKEFSSIDTTGTLGSILCKQDCVHTHTHNNMNLWFLR